MKRFYFWALLVTLVIVIAGLIWFFFFNKPITPGLPAGVGGALPGGGTGRDPNTPPSKNPIGGGGGIADFQYISPLEKIWDKPVAGFSFAVIPVIVSSTSTNDRGQEVITQTRSTSTYLFFIEKATGNVYKKDFSTNKIIRVTNTTIPAVQDALFLKNGTLVVLQIYNRVSKKVETIVSDIPQTISVNSPLSLGAPTSLQDNITSMVSSLNGEFLYYLVPNQKGSSLYRYSKDKGSVFVESFPLKELELSINNKQVYVSSKPSAFVPGYVFKTSPFVIIYGGKTGFSFLPSPTDTLSYISMWSDKGLFSYVHSLVNGSDYTFDGSFLSDKCSWSPVSSFLLCANDSDVFIGENGLPEAWYQGDVSFKDSLYVVAEDRGSFITRELINISDEAKESIDLIKPRFDSSSVYFSFTNKRDGSLWLLDVFRAFNP